MYFLRLLRVFYRTSVQTDMEYRADFFTRVFASLLGLLTTVGSLWITFHYTPQLRGWTFTETLVLVAVYYVINGLVETFIAPNMREIMNQVREGTLDFVIIKPVSSQFMATFRSVNIWMVSNLLIGLGLGVYAVGAQADQIGWGRALAFFVTLLAGVSVVYSVWLVLVSLTFWFVRVDNIEQIIWQAFETGRYPIEIYPNWLRSALTYVIPVVFIITIPARALIGRLTGDTLVLTILVAAASVIASSAFWKFGLKYYTGASA